MRSSREDPFSPLPWFERRAGATVAVALALFVAVFVLRLVQGADSGQAITMLFVLPISLLAVTFGTRGGVAAGVFAVMLVVAWAAFEEVQLSSMGWLSRILPLMLLGFLVGRAADILRRAESRRRALELSAVRHREAIEINDTLVQGMTAAKWALESGRSEAGLETLSRTLTLGHQLVSALMRDADKAAHTHVAGRAGGQWDVGRRPAPLLDRRRR